MEYLSGITFQDEPQGPCFYNADDLWDAIDGWIDPANMTFGVVLWAWEG